MRKACLVVLALVFAAPLWAEEAKANPPARGPRIALEPASFDFGQALQNKELVKEFNVRNFGNEDLVIENVSTSCGCTAALLSDKDKIVKPGGSAPLQVKLQTRTNQGRLQKTVLIKSNDPAKNMYELKIEADVVPGK